MRGGIERVVVGVYVEGMLSIVELSLLLQEEDI
jgi:hypothetical protein